jgi:putative hydroxymethylpyrimidine transport system substrate-binding protein
MKGCLWAVAVATAAALICGCGQSGTSERAETSRAVETAEHRPAAKKRPKPPAPKPHKKLKHLRLTLDQHEGPTSVGIMMAAARGYFADVGLSVWIGDPQTPNRPVRYVADGTVDLGVTHLPEVALAQERGAPIVGVGSLVPEATMAMIWTKDSKIGGIGNLKGKTIAITGLPFEEGFLRSVLARHGLTLGDVKVKKVGYELVNSLLFHHADAIFGGSWNLEAVELEELALKPTVIRVGKLGIPAYDELVVIARSSRVAEEPKLIRDFMSAVGRGTAAAVKDPAGALKVIEEGNEGNPDATPEITEAELEATLPLLSRHGYMDPARARRLGEWMFEQGMLEREPQVSELLTNRYL